MGRMKKFFLLLFAGLFAFGGALYFFFPLDAAARTLWREAARKAAAEGFVLDSSGIESARIPLRITLMNLSVSSPLLSGEAGRAEFAPSLLSSLRALAPAGRLHLERVSLALHIPGEPPLFLSSLDALLTARGEEIEGVILETGGDLDISGRMVISSRKGSLQEADLLLKGSRSALQRRGGGGLVPSDVRRRPDRGLLSHPDRDR